MIMVGPGTGVAPFRGFLHERLARGDAGRNWLFFGEQHAATDFYYRDELEGDARKGPADAARSGVFPRPGREDLRAGPHARTGRGSYGRGSKTARISTYAATRAGWRRMSMRRLKAVVARHGGMSDERAPSMSTGLDGKSAMCGMSISCIWQAVVELKFLRFRDRHLSRLTAEKPLMARRQRPRAGFRSPM